MVDLLVQTALQAGVAVMNVYSEKYNHFEIKEDNSPLTKADLESNRIIVNKLQKHYPNIPILSEEGKHITYDTRKSWDEFFMIDPLDGTKEFIHKNGEFTINIAFVKKSGFIHLPSLGVVYAPALNKIYWNNKTTAFTAMTSKDHQLFEDSITEIRSGSTESKFTIIGSRSHSNESTISYINILKEKYKNLEFISMGSSLKLCLIAEGKAQIYPRLGPTMEWDTAAAHAICNKSNCLIYQFNENEPFVKTQLLQYNKPNLLNPYFVVEANNLI